MPWQSRARSTSLSRGDDSDGTRFQGNPAIRQVRRNQRDRPSQGHEHRTHASSHRPAQGSDRRDERDRQSELGHAVPFGGRHPAHQGKRGGTDPADDLPGQKPHGPAGRHPVRIHPRGPDHPLPDRRRRARGRPQGGERGLRPRLGDPASNHPHHGNGQGPGGETTWTEPWTSAPAPSSRRRRTRSSRR